MQEVKLTKIFKNAKYEPDQKLAFSIWSILITKDKKTTQIKMWSLSSILFVSLIGLVPAFQMLISDLAHSGFYEYFSLIFSDGGSMLAYWKELSLSLAQSIPVMSIVLTLSLFFVCFLSLKYLLKQISKDQSLGSSSLLLSI
jgi:hypothetical protein